MLQCSRLESLCIRSASTGTPAKERRGPDGAYRAIATVLKLYPTRRIRVRQNKAAMGLPTVDASVNEDAEINSSWFSTKLLFRGHFLICL